MRSGELKPSITSVEPYIWFNQIRMPVVISTTKKMGVSIGEGKA
jgi:hypothetical protein